MEMLGFFKMVLNYVMQTSLKDDKVLKIVFMTQNNKIIY